MNHNNHLLNDVSFADDTAMPVTAPAGEVVSKVTAVAQFAFRVFGCFRLGLNFLHGKSECVPALAGTGKKLAMQTLARAGNKSSFDDLKGNLVQLLLVRTCRHVGTQMPFDAQIGEEVSTRCGLIFNGSFQLRKQILTNPLIVMSKRLFIFRCT